MNSGNADFPNSFNTQLLNATISMDIATVSVLRHIRVVSEGSGGFFTSTRWRFSQFIQITLGRRKLVGVISLGTVVHLSNIFVSILVWPLGCQILLGRCSSRRDSSVQKLLAIESGRVFLVARLIVVNVDPDNRVLSLFLVLFLLGSVQNEVRLHHWSDRGLQRMLFLLLWIGLQSVNIPA